MKKAIICLALLFVATYASAVPAATPISVDSFLSPDDITIAHLEQFRTVVVNEANNKQGGLIQPNTISGDRMVVNTRPEVRWDEAFNDWVYTGLLPPTSASLAATTTAGTAYISGNRISKDATAKTYTASRWTYVDLTDQGTYTYTETAISAGVPAIAVGSIRLARVSTDGTTVNNVRDDRLQSISLDSSQENFQRVGLQLTVNTPDALMISPGVVFHGTTRFVKTSETTLNLATGGDWAAGGGSRGNSYGYVAINPSGTLQLTTTAPTLHDSAGNTAGKLRYSDITGTKWRVLNWFYMDNVSNDIQAGQYGNFKDGDAPNISFVTADSDISTASTTFVDMTDMITYFYSSGNPVTATFAAPLSADQTSDYIVYTINVDGTNLIQSSWGNDDAGTTKEVYPGYVTFTDVQMPQGTHTIKTQWRVNEANGYQDGNGAGRRTLTIMEH